MRNTPFVSMMKNVFAAVLFFNLIFPIHSARANFAIATDGKPECVIIRQAGATAPELKAADELAKTLEQITGAKFSIRDANEKISGRAILIGPGAIAKKYFPEVPFEKLGTDEIVIRTKGNKLLLAGGRTRGTLYAVCRFLQNECGVCWWTPWATTIPHRPNLRVQNLNIRYTPPFEYRSPFWFAAFEEKWAYRNGSNDQFAGLTAADGGCIQYKGFSHTFYKLVPPEKYFAEHPEWFSMIKGKRTADHAQLCLTNPKLRDFVVQRVKEWLRESPDAKIISVTQNDWNNWCECPDCKALDDAEGSHAGTMLTFANYIAEKIAPEFPNVAVDTFAYHYTRTPPKTLKARPNVIVRLCSIECNFREPLDDPSNAKFADDIRQWKKICPRLYVWDYTTDFSNYVLPHPNWFTLGPNMRFFQKNGVKGVFEEGGYQDYGGEMSEMRAWVLAQLLWNPKLDNRKLVHEFLNGYYGEKAGPLIEKYLKLIYKSSEGLFIGCNLKIIPPTHLRFEILTQAEQLWQQAENALRNDPEKLARVRIGHVPVRFVFLKYWKWLRDDCKSQNTKWPISKSRETVGDEFREVCKGVPGKAWTHVNRFNERGMDAESFLAKFGGK
jgi:hypothetical protein